MRLDTFNSKYNPFGNSELKTVFLEHSNDIKGRYFAELAKSVLRKRSRNPFQLYEYRLQLSGRTRQDWDELADWLVLHEIESSQVHWVVEISSSYSVFKKNGDVQKYQDMLDSTCFSSCRSGMAD
jgi:AMP deaminase